MSFYSRSARAALLGGVSLVSITIAGAMRTSAQEALPEIKVTADKVEGTTWDSPSTVSVKTDSEIDRQNITSARDLVRDEPGVSVGNQPARGGMTNYVIRGVGENRVRLEIDGVKIPDFPGTNIGSPTGYTRDFVDYDSLKRVEIIRGPASALYGSDAIGGVVSFVTKDPGDYLAMVNKDWFLSQKAGFDTADSSFYATSTGAARMGNWESMVLYTYRHGREVKPNTVLEPNPQEFRTDNVLAKVVHHHETLGDFRLTGEIFQRRIETNINTDKVVLPSSIVPPFGARIFDSTAIDTNDRPRVSLDWNAPVNAWWADVSLLKLYWTKVLRQEQQDQTRSTSATAPAATILRHSDFDFDQNIFGAEWRLDAKRQYMGWHHHITYGAVADTTATTRPRDRYQLTFATGAITKTVAGEPFPNKNFPDTNTTNAGAYVQDIMQYGPLRLIPAIRYDFFQLTPHPDADFMRSNLAGFQISSQTEHAISPKFGVTYDLTENYRLVGQYTRGFRAPPYDNANFGFRNLTSFYEILPNGNLEPETSDGYEGGLRARFANGSYFEVTAFWNNYHNFIETVLLTDPPPAPPAFQQFQYQNVSSVTIRGIEGKGEWRFHPTWSLFGAFAYAYGINNDLDRPIDSVDPFTAVGGLRYRNGGWIGEGRVRYYASKNRVSTPAIFTVPEHTVVDALLSYEVFPQFTISGGIFNVFDLAYYDPQAVAGVTAFPTGAGAIGAVPIELYRAPGRTFALNAIVRW